MDLTKGYLPIVTVVSVVFFVSWVTKIVVEEKLVNDHRFDQTNRVIQQLATATKELAESMALRGRVWWSKDDMYYWCVRQKAKLPELECPGASSYSPTLDIEEPAKRSIQKLDAIEHDKALTRGKPQ